MVKRRFFRRAAVSLALLTGLVLILGGGWFCAWQYRLSLARGALSRHDAAEAMRWLRAAERWRPRHAETHFLLARASRRLGDVHALRRHLELAHEYGWPAERLEREWILAQAQVGLLEQAEPHLRALLLAPGDDGPEICAAFANGYAHHFRYHDTMEILEAWQADYPDDPQPYLMRGKIRQRWRHWADAETEYRAALERAPAMLEVRRRLAEVLTAQHKYEEAVVEFRACLEKIPDDPELLAAWGECLMNLGDDEARPVFERLLQLDPRDCTARAGLGQLALESGRVEEALSWLTSAVEDCPKRTDVRYAYAKALVAAGRHSEAQEHFAYFEEANDALIRVSDLSGDLIREPGDIETRFEIGRLVLKYGNADEGEKWLKTVLAAAPHHEATHALLAELYASRGETK